MSNADRVEIEIEQPIYSDFVIENCKGLQGQDGVYYHYSEVVNLLKKWNTRPEPTLKSSEGFESVRNVLNEYVVDFEICEIVDGENIDCNRQKSLDYITNVILSTITPTPETASEGENA